MAKTPRKSKKIIAEERTSMSPGDLEGPLGSLAKRIQEYIEDFGPDAYLEWDQYNHYPYSREASPIYRLKIEREESDEEFSKRLAEESARQAIIDTREKEEFERLQKKFGVK